MHSKISKLLVVYIVLFSSIITLLLTAAQLYMDYKNGVANIEKTMKLVQTTNLGSLAQSAWTHDQESIEIQLSSIINLEDIIYAKYKENDSDTLLEAGDTSSSHHALTRSVDVEYRYQGELLYLGEFSVAATKEHVYQQLYDTALIIVITQGIKTFLVSLFILLIFQYLVTRHLEVIMHYSEQLDFRRSNQTLKLPRRANRFTNGDELERLVSSLNQTAEKMFNSYSAIAKNHEALARMAVTDSLTELPNRIGLHQHMDRQIELSRDKDRHFAVVIIDLDGFKNVNDSLGHFAGDRLLQLICPRIQACLNEGDIVARLGGDEFALILCSATDREQLLEQTEQIRTSIATPYSIYDLDIVLSASVGLSLYPDQGTTASDLLRLADLAMYRAKKDKAGCHVYNPEQDSISRRQLALTSDLKRAIENNEFQLYYQPKVASNNHACVSCEALIRWIHPEYGFVPPNEFIGYAELGELINPLTYWVARQALMDAKKMHEIGNILSVSINVSARNLIDNKFPVELIHIAQDVGIDTGKVILEITERTIMTDPGRCIANIKLLTEAGFNIAIDDFGTGYSSLENLSKINAHELKIDQSFVFSMDEADNGNNRNIVLSTIELAHSLKMRVTAEGVETHEVSKLLKEMHCELLQGYYFSKPLPFDEFCKWLNINRSEESPHTPSTC